MGQRAALHKELRSTEVEILLKTAKVRHTSNLAARRDDLTKVGCY
jgi:hypothetical protein